MNIIFFGTSFFSAQILQFLKEKNISVKAIVTRPDKPQKRSKQPVAPPVKKMAEEIFSDIPLFQPQKASDPFFVKELSKFSVDFFVVVAYGQLLKENVLNLPKIDSINVHTSLLPQYRGASPIRRCLMDGAKETGITIMRMVLEMDAGEILHQEKMFIPDNMNFEQLQNALIEISESALINVLENYSTIEKIKQDPIFVSFAPKISSKETKIRWDLAAQTIHNQIRALSPSPGAWCEILMNKEVKRLKFFFSEVICIESAPKKIISITKKELIIGCAKDALKILDVQLEGKKRLSIEDWLKGINKESFRIV